ncbi:MAG: hypothetical protein ACRD7E_22840 [Bryobacteraceae bacterium]
MRYITGSINLNSKDGALLEIVGTATRITHRQLFEMAQLKRIETERRVYDWRVRRLVTHALLKRDRTLFCGSDPVYTITRSGVRGMEQLGIHLLSVYIEPEDDDIDHQVQHSVELNRIHLALLRSGVLARWTPAKFLQALNLAAPFDYAKYYDAIATLRMGNERIDLAIEYEHTLKRPAERYAAVRTKIEREKRADAVLFVTPTPALSLSLRSQFRDVRKTVLFVQLQDLDSQRLQATVDYNYLSMTLGEALQRTLER